MTKQEYNWYHREVKDALGHRVKAGDLVIFHWWDKRVEIGKVVKVCNIVLKISPLKWKNFPSWVLQRSPERVIKIKKNAIPKE